MKFQFKLQLLCNRNNDFNISEIFIPRQTIDIKKMQEKKNCYDFCADGVFFMI